MKSQATRGCRSVQEANPGLDENTEMSMWAATNSDLSFYHRLRYPSSRSRLVKAFVATSSPGWWRLVLHRCVYDLERRRRAPGAERYALAFTVAGLPTLPIEMLLNMITKSPIDGQCRIEEGVYLSDLGGIVLGCSRIGSGTVVQHDVTFGMNQLRSSELPEIGRDVWVGHDSVIYGPIVVSDGATILPGSVVSTSVPAEAVIAGNPGRIIMHGFDNSALRATLDDPVLPTQGPTTIFRARSLEDVIEREELNVP